MEAICADVLRSQKLPLKRIGFKQLTFGDAPFRIESEWLSRGRLDAGWMACWKYRGHVLWQVLTGHHALEPPFPVRVHVYAPTLCTLGACPA